ncbi:hypothetical protein B0J11DRAFT_525312 [Dendryphion nanum]|uniref:medium-chain acyl-CoA ligase n=1 Tax=Dendryphion nanum TaxID=256645 RepID=A0A9P9IRL4_9PLEO|nr:hypothetical protein B0J11DRAFT_525312 [Dendryphion nanum]
MDFPRPDKFNFAIDVMDDWAAQPGNLKAMHWVSQDESSTRVLSFDYFSRQSHRISVLFERLGIKRGDTIVMILPRVPAWWEIALAAIRSGVILAPATTLLTDKDIGYRCITSKAAVFVGDAVSVEKFLSVKKDCPSVRTIIQVGDTPQEDAVPFDSALETVENNAEFSSIRQDSKSPALLYFTSGTSGPPKMVRHNQISYPLALASTGKHWYKLAPGKTLWNTAEQGWAKAAWSFFGAWNCGATLFVHDDRGAFDPQRLLRILHQYPINTICAAPLAYRQLVLPKAREYLRQHPPMSLSHCTTAGEALNGEVTRKWHADTGLKIHEGYGQTETVLLCGNFDEREVRLGSMGRPAPGVPLHVITASGTESDEGEEGDIAVLLNDKFGSDKFFGLFDGYVQEDGTSNRREKILYVNGEVKIWYLTGDRATRDADGYFWFVGRADDVINSSGYRIGPFEVESALAMHPSVAESAVVSSPDPVRGEVVKAFVVLKSEYQNARSENLKQELQAFCKKTAAPYKYPRKIDFVQSDFFPKTASGKIQRNELRKLEWSKESKSKL